MSEFFREVDEEVRRDRLIKLWKTYQNWVIGLIVLILVGTGAREVYTKFNTDAAEASGVRYEAALALLESGKSDEAETALNGLAQGGTAGYAELSRFLAAGLAATKDPAAGI